MLLQRLDGKVVNLPYIADARDESAKLAERDSLLGIDYYYKRAVICGVQTERSLGQPRLNGSGRSVEVTIRSAASRNALVRAQAKRANEIVCLTLQAFLPKF
jgi:hypothetical protein